MLLEAKKLSFRYSRQGPWLLENLSLSVESRERLCIFAPSGYGKTTLAMLLSGYLIPQKGQILISGQPLPGSGPHPVQLICQHPEKAIDPRWRLKRVLEECGGMDGETLKAFGIERQWLERFPRELSGGELQRFCIARAITAKPKFLICDEISTMLDAITQAQIWKVILDETEKNSIGLISITHNIHLARRISDHIFDLQKQEYI